MTSGDPSDGVSTGEETAIVPGPIRIHGERRADLVEIGSKLGRYTLLERVGMGGMGVVYAAFDPELDRKVALKLLWPGSKDDTRTRLVREAQAMARLSHKNIVSVYDVGTLDDRVFMAMEYVEGQTLTRWLRDDERSWRDALGVFVQAGRGLAAAHAADLMHRDFKPENVLIGDDGRVQVTDFGLARAITGEDSDQARYSVPIAEPMELSALSIKLTHAGTVIGTPAYMAPEQHAGENTDARTDQYNFCVALFEGLYGKRPFAGRSVEELSANKKNGRVETPDGIDVPSWVAKAVRRGLEPNPDNRWPSMGDLLHALEPDSSAHRRRTLAGMALAGVLGLGLFGVFGGRADEAVTCQGSERLSGVWDDARRATVRDAVLATGVAYARSTLELVESKLDGYAESWAAAYTEACEATRVSGEQPAEVLDLRMTCLGERRAALEALVSVLEHADLSTVEHASPAVANLPGLERCGDVETLAASIRSPEDPDVAQAVAAIRERLATANALADASRYDEGLEQAQGALATAEALDFPAIHAEALFLLGDIRSDLGQYSVAEEVLERAHWMATGAKHDRIAVTAATNLVYLVGYRMARLEDALAWGRHADAALTRFGGGGAEEANLLNNVGSVLLQQGKLDEAIAKIEQALEIRSSLQAEGPAVATLHNSMGNALYAKALYAESEKHYQEGLELGRRVYGADHPRIALFLNNLGSLYGMMGRRVEARSNFERALSIYQNVFGPEHPHVAREHYNIGAVYQLEGDYTQAGVHYRRALVIREQALGTEHPEVADTLQHLGTLFAHELRYDEAVAYYQRAYAIFEGVLGSDHRAIATPLTGLGLVHLERGEPEVALPLLRRAMQLREKHGSDPVMLGQTQFGLARALWDTATERERARPLAVDARKAFLGAGMHASEQLAEVELWLTDPNADLRAARVPGR